MASPRWGLAATVKAPADQVLAFVAHHLDLGAHRIWLHFDDPDDPSAGLFAGQRRVTAVRCDDGYWASLAGRRPPTHQARQMRNITRVYQRCKLDWVAHLDVDEYLLAQRPVPEILAEQPDDRLILRAEPHEALHDPGLPDDIFTARHFRRALPDPDPDRLATLFGRYGALLPKGMLSHTVGKCLFRVGVPDMEPSIHGARIEGERVFAGRFHPDLRLLHFHAEDPARWQQGLGFRLSKGAYQYMPALQAYLLAADPAEVEAFYAAVQITSPEVLARLGAMGLLVEAELGLRSKVAAFAAGA